MKSGIVVIVPTAQAGTVLDHNSVLLANGDIWTGDLAHCRKPQDQADLDAALYNVEKFVNKPKDKPKQKQNKWADSKEYDIGSDDYQD